jgi:Domain of unknown function (DUF4186)
VVDLRGITTVRRHAEELVRRRLATAQPRNDGRQTPYRGHPVFVVRRAARHRDVHSVAAELHDRCGSRGRKC